MQYNNKLGAHPLKGSKAHFLPFWGKGDGKNADFFATIINQCLNQQH